MSVCPKCGAPVSMYDTGGTPWYACGSKGTFRSGSCVDREPVATQLREAQQRIKRLEEAAKVAAEQIKTMAEIHSRRSLEERQRVLELEAAIRKTLDENRHLADGENCTLIELKKALPEWT